MSHFPLISDNIYKKPNQVKMVESTNKDQMECDDEAWEAYGQEEEIDW